LGRGTRRDKTRATAVGLSDDGQTDGVRNVQPSVGFYNLFNFANFDLPGNTLNELLTGTAGQINGTTSEAHNITRVGVGTGVYSLGAPRQIEFGLRLTF